MKKFEQLLFKDIVLRLFCFTAYEPFSGHVMPN